MSIRMWPALFAWGAGLIHIAVAAGSPLGVLVPLTALGAAELVWGIAMLRLGRMPLVRWALAVGVVATLAGLVLALFDLMAWIPLVSSSVMLVAIAGAAAVTVRRSARGRDPRGSDVPGSDVPGSDVRGSDAEASARPSVPAGRTLVGVLAGALLVSALTTPALAQTKAGDYAVPHGEMTSHHGH
jgi:hypothetical protein